VVGISAVGKRRQQRGQYLRQMFSQRVTGDARQHGQRASVDWRGRQLHNNIRHIPHRLQSTDDSLDTVETPLTVVRALTLLVGLQEGHLACKKTEWWGDGMAEARCRLAYGPADATATHCLSLQ